MNAQAILTPGGIADQLSNGLSGVAQAFVQHRRNQQLQQQQDFDNNQATLRMQLAQAADERQSAAAALEAQHWNASNAMAQQGHTDRQAQLGIENARADAATKTNNQQFYLNRGVVPPGTDEFQSESPVMTGLRGVGQTLGYDTHAPYTPEGSVAANMRDKTTAHQGRTADELLMLQHDRERARDEEVAGKERIAAIKDAQKAQANWDMAKAQAKEAAGMTPEKLVGMMPWSHSPESAQAAIAQWDANYERQNPRPQASAATALDSVQPAGDWKARAANFKNFVTP